MSDRRRFGNADASKEPALAAHWAIASLVLTTQILCTLYTQYHQHKLDWEKRVKFQNIGTVWEVDVMALALILWPIATGIGAQGGNSQLINCVWYVLWGHFMGAISLAIQMYRSLLFAYRVAQIERARIIHREGSPDYLPSPQERTKLRHRKTNINWAIKYLRPHRLKVGAFVVFLICAGPLIFFDYDNIKWATGKSKECRGQTSTYAAVMWYFWVVPFFYVVRKIIIDDPYEIIYKLKVQTFGMTVGMLIFLPIAFFLEPVIGTSHHGLLSFEVFVCFYAFIWYSECWLPLVLTWKKLEENAKIDAASQNYDMVDVLADPGLLHSFESHLIKEWAVENLQFYKTATLFHLHILKQIRKIQVVYKKGKKKEAEFFAIVGGTFKSECTRAIRIYLHFLAPNSPQQVNLPSRMCRSLEDFFKNQLSEVGIYLEAFTTRVSRSGVGSMSKGGTILYSVQSAHSGQRGRVDKVTQSKQTSQNVAGVTSTAVSSAMASPLNTKGKNHHGRGTTNGNGSLDQTNELDPIHREDSHFHSDMDAFYDHVGAGGGSRAGSGAVSGSGSGGISRGASGGASGGASTNTPKNANSGRNNSRSRWRRESKWESRGEVPLDHSISMGFGASQSAFNATTPAHASAPAPASTPAPTPATPNPAPPAPGPPQSALAQRPTSPNMPSLSPSPGLTSDKGNQLSSHLGSEFGSDTAFGSNMGSLTPNLVSASASRHNSTMGSSPTRKADAEPANQGRRASDHRDLKENTAEHGEGGIEIPLISSSSPPNASVVPNRQQRSLTMMTTQKASHSPRSVEIKTGTGGWGGSRRGPGSGTVGESGGSGEGGVGGVGLGHGLGLEQSGGKTVNRANRAVTVSGTGSRGVWTTNGIGSGGASGGASGLVSGKGSAAAGFGIFGGDFASMDEKSVPLSRKISSHTPNHRLAVNSRIRANAKFCKAIANTAAFIADINKYSFLKLAKSFDNKEQGTQGNQHHKETKTQDDATQGVDAKRDPKQDAIAQIYIITQLLSVFDEAKGEAFALMERDSFRRFAASIAKATKKLAQDTPRSTRASPERKRGKSIKTKNKRDSSSLGSPRGSNPPPDYCHV